MMVQPHRPVLILLGRVFPAQDRVELSQKIKDDLDQIPPLIHLKRAQDALQASEARFKSLFENAVVGIFRTTRPNSDRGAENASGWRPTSNRWTSD
jgi:PAS domain-containing protein